MIEKLNKYLISMKFFPLGRCSCKGKPFRWKNETGFEVKLYNDDTWQLLNGQILRYGYIETAIEEINEFYQKFMGETDN
jgi:hypothetical protein